MAAMLAAGGYQNLPVAQPVGFVACPIGDDATMFLAFSNRLGCLGSLLVSIVGTLILLLILGVID